MKPAPDEIAGGARQDQPVAINDDDAVKRDRSLLFGPPGPIANRRDRDHERCDPNPGAPFLYGRPQCGQTALPSIRFFWQFGHGTRLPFGRVVRCTIKPTGQTSQPRMVTSWAFSELRAFASRMIQMAVKIQAPIITAIKRK
jgi:hypothetical protein